MKYTSNKDINNLIKRLIRSDWVFKHGSKHGRLTSPDGILKITVSKSPSDHRCFKNFRSDVRRINNMLHNL